MNPLSIKRWLTTVAFVLGLLLCSHVHAIYNPFSAIQATIKTARCGLVLDTNETILKSIFSNLLSLDRRAIGLKILNGTDPDKNDQIHILLAVEEALSGIKPSSQALASSTTVSNAASAITSSASSTVATLLKIDTNTAAATLRAACGIIKNHLATLPEATVVRLTQLFKQPLLWKAAFNISSQLPTQAQDKLAQLGKALS